MNTDSPVQDVKPTPKRKPPIWPWVVVLILVIAGILVHRELTLMFDDLQQTGRDFIQLFEWLLSLVDG